jgi:hypothetical protein
VLLACSTYLACQLHMSPMQDRRALNITSQAAIAVMRKNNSKWRSSHTSIEDIRTACRSANHGE